MNKFISKIFPTGWHFELIYLAVAIATFEHTAWAFGSLFLGAPSTEYFTLSDPIWLRGALVATAIDIGLFLIAKAMVQYSKQPTTNKFGYLQFGIAFGVVAIISFYAQLLFAYYHTPSLEIASGVTEYWSRFLQPVIDSAPFVIAACLPLIATLFTFTRILLYQNKQKLVAHKQRTEKKYQLIVDGKVKEFRTQAGFKRALTRHKNNGKNVEVLTQPEVLQLPAGNTK